MTSAAGTAYGLVMGTLPAPRGISGPEATAAIHEQGAHLVTWTPTGEQPVLWVSRDTLLEEGAAIRGGVPICFPWFGPGRSGDRKPSHGPARTTRWEPVVIEEARAELTLTLGALRATYAVRAGRRLELALRVTNVGSQEETYEEALHTYLAVGDVRQVSLEGLDRASYVDKTDQGATRRQEGPVTLRGETDRVYRSACPVTVVDPVLGRRLRITTSGSASTVVWNPWADKAAGLADMGDDEWTGMVCVEGGNVLADEITLAPGDSHTLRYEIEVLPL